MKTFNTLEEALAHITGQDTQISALKAENADLKKAAENTGKDLEKTLNEVAALSAKLDMQEKHGKDGIIVTVKKKSYTLVGNRFVYGGKEYTAKELSQDTKQLEKMVEKKSGSLIAID